MKRILIVLLALVMIPVFLGVLCPCVMAASPNQPSFQSMKCHACCPEMNSSSECQSAVQTQTGSLAVEFFKVINVLKALCPGESQGIAINRRALVPAGDEPSPGFVQPLYLALNVLRI
jgi:hypothetical protein